MQNYRAQARWGLPRCGETGIFLHFGSKRERRRERKKEAWGMKRERERKNKGERKREVEKVDRRARQHLNPPQLRA